MLRRVPRVLRAAVLGTVLLAVLASIAQSWSNATPGAGGYVQTQWGPLGPADRNLLVAVRLAGLWEAPTGQQAEQQAVRAEVQQVGANLGAEHPELDRITREAADQLGVLLPSSPNAQQMAWMQELSGLTGTEYDRRFVQIVREAHGTVLPVISQVRAGTRNELVRQFATTANEYVTRHIGYLESTGLVDYEALPEPPSPGLLSLDRGPIDLVVPGLVVVAALLTAAGLLTALRRRPRPAAGGAAVPGGPPVTGRAIAAIAAGPAAPAGRAARVRIPAPRPATPTDSGAYRITDTPTGAHRGRRDGTRVDLTAVGTRFAGSGYADVGYAPEHGDAEHPDTPPAGSEYADVEYADVEYADVEYADVEYAGAADTDAADADVPYAGAADTDADHGVAAYHGGRDGDRRRTAAAPVTGPSEVPVERTGPVQRVRRSRARHSVRT